MDADQRGPALLLIDVQRGFDDPVWGRRNNVGAEGRMAALLSAWREAKLPVVHVRHNSTNPASVLHPDHPGHRFKPEVEPLGSEPVVEKSVNSAFIGTDLEVRLHAAGITRLVVVGLTTDHCVSTTVRMAGNLGFMTTVVSDATATFDKRGPDGTTFPADLVHEVSLASLHGEFATVCSSGALLEQLNLTCLKEAAA